MICRIDHLSDHSCASSAQPSECIIFTIVLDNLSCENVDKRGMSVQRIKSLLQKIANDEQGGEVLEYALIAGLIVVVAISVVKSVGTKTLGRWQSVNSSM